MLPEERPALLRPEDPYWEKCARHQNLQTTRSVAHMFLCDGCADRLRRESFNGRAPLFAGLAIRGYCGLCNALVEPKLYQWFVCQICLNVVLSYPKGFAASKYVHEFWAREITPEFPNLVLQELDEVKLEAFVPGRRSAKTKAASVQPLDYLVGVQRDGSVEPIFYIELKAGPASIEQMSAFQLDVNDFNDIANGCNGCGLPAYVFHVQINDDYLPPTRRSIATDLWWTDLSTLESALTAVRPRRGEDKLAAYYKPSAFRGRESFIEEVRGQGYRAMSERLRDNKISLI